MVVLCYTFCCLVALFNWLIMTFIQMISKHLFVCFFFLQDLDPIIHFLLLPVCMSFSSNSQSEFYNKKWAQCKEDRRNLLLQLVATISQLSVSISSYFVMCQSQRKDEQVFTATTKSASIYYPISILTLTSFLYITVTEYHSIRLLSCLHFEYGTWSMNQTAAFVKTVLIINVYMVML